MIQLQCLYLDKVKDKLLPQIEAMLEQRKEALLAKKEVK